MSAIQWPDWPEGNDDVEYAERGQEYAAVDTSVFFVPYSRAKLKFCAECGDFYINSAYLADHIADAHGASRQEPRPESVPAAVLPDRVRPQLEPHPGVRPQPQPEPERPAERVPRKGAPRSVPSTRGRNRNTTRRSR